ncbi:MAG: porin family protein [Muribaculaceae bacterium]|nr:porin family protein [Muribaculaceae bacterium]
MPVIKQFTVRLLAIAAIVAALSLPTEAQIIKGEKSLGTKIGYVTKNESASAGLVFQYAFTQHLRIAPEIGYVFRNNNLDAFTFDINAHFPFDFTGENVAFYPLGGLNYSSWCRRYNNPETDWEIMAKSDEVSTRTSRFGLNLGAGFDLRCSETLKVTFEAKYTLIKSYSTAAICAGISYVF